MPSRHSHGGSRSCSGRKPPLHRLPHSDSLSLSESLLLPFSDDPVPSFEVIRVRFRENGRFTCRPKWGLIRDVRVGMGRATGSGVPTLLMLIVWLDGVPAPDCCGLNSSPGRPSSTSGSWFIHSLFSSVSSTSRMGSSASSSSDSRFRARFASLSAELLLGLDLSWLLFLTMMYQRRYRESLECISICRAADRQTKLRIKNSATEMEFRNSCVPMYPAESIAKELSETSATVCTN
mmetsp:Transcript_74379/g.210080  ORF Transcript_74379/g.210080 Transcript_74379/m.210080 type:complete len:235 (-) Transcript_74379:551-1255(-)